MCSCVPSTSFHSLDKACTFISILCADFQTATTSSILKPTSQFPICDLCSVLQTLYIVCLSTRISILGPRGAVRGSYSSINIWNVLLRGLFFRKPSHCLLGEGRSILLTFSCRNSYLLKTTCQIVNDDRKDALIKIRKEKQIKNLSNVQERKNKPYSNESEILNIYVLT